MMAQRALTLRTIPQPEVVPDPHRPGADFARVAPFNTPVWALVAYWQGLGQDVTRVAAEFGIPATAVDAALAYYRQPEHRAAIDALIEANNAAALP